MIDFLTHWTAKMECTKHTNMYLTSQSLKSHRNNTNSSTAAMDKHWLTLNFQQAFQSIRHLTTRTSRRKKCRACVNPMIWWLRQKFWRWCFTKPGSSITRRRWRSICLAKRCWWAVLCHVTNHIWRLNWRAHCALRTYTINHTKRLFLFDASQ